MIFDVKEDKLDQNCSFKVESWPRYFTATEDGYIYVACQRANLVEKYYVTPEKITLLSQLAMMTPSCVVVL